MLYNKVYNELFTKEMRSAYISRDVSFFRNELEKLRDKEFNVDNVSTMLLLTALLDSLTTGGKAVSFVMDYINL